MLWYTVFASHWYMPASSLLTVRIWKSWELLQPGPRSWSSLKKRKWSWTSDFGGWSWVSQIRVTGPPSIGWEGLAVSTGCGNSSRENRHCSQGSGRAELPGRNVWVFKYSRQELRELCKESPLPPWLRIMKLFIKSPLVSTFPRFSPSFSIKTYNPPKSSHYLELGSLKALRFLLMTKAEIFLRQYSGIHHCSWRLNLM